MEFRKDGYVFYFNHIQGIINIETDTESEEFVDCMEFGAGYKLSQIDFEEKCNDWLEHQKKY